MNELEIIQQSIDELTKILPDATIKDLTEYLMIKAEVC